jgi:hypothetical protein
MNSIEPMKNGRTIAKKMARMRDPGMGLSALWGSKMADMLRAGVRGAEGGRGRGWSEQPESKIQMTVDHLS